ncbi:hypothetical protein [Desertihabitans brevis]|uniref:hypothetical protein n=1 Tax=Desertihabitans brevis TaxID=2268447 RepID=UPI001F45BF96|nr:hypothetical protein [Desertihabitans brevis]
MSQPDLGPILEDLAAGRLTPAEAARRIDALKAEPVDDVQNGRPQHATHASERVWPLDGEDTGTDPTDPRPTGAADEPARPREPEDLSVPDRGSVNGVDRVSVRTVGRRVRIIGDRKVSTAAVDGPNVVRRNGDVLEITSEGELGPSFDGFSVLRPPRSLDDVRSMGLGKELVVRVNPVLAVDAEVTAGSLTTERVPWLGRIRVTAGGARMSEVAEVNDALVQAGQATLTGALRTGRSRVKVESGSLTIELDDRSNVTIRSDAQLGKVSWSGGHTGAGDEVVMGQGNARLDIGVVMGHAAVRVGTP